MNISLPPKPVARKGLLADLTDEQSQQLLQWLESTQTFKQTAQRVAKDFGIPGVTTSILKNFRQKHGAPAAPEPVVAYRPPFVPENIWEFSLGKMIEELKNPETPIEIRVRISAFFLQLVRMSLDQSKLKAKGRAKKPSKAKVVKVEPVEEPNPLDDDDKLEEVRRLVFGFAPQTTPQPEPLTDATK